MLYNFCYLFIIFFVYAFIGYVSEVINISILEKRLVLSRGFLIGPYIPIFGVGGIFMTLFLNRYSNDIFVLFITSMCSCLIIEYLCSLFLEKLFNLRWWDYSNMKFNLDGRICLENGILFGIAGVLVIKILYPFLSYILHSIPNNIVIIIGLILAIIFLIDIIISYSITFRLKKTLDNYSRKDATEDIKKLIRVELKKKRFFVDRLIKSFPNAKKWYYSKLNIKQVINKISNYRKK